MNRISYKRNLVVPFLKMLLDAMAVELAVIAAYYVRFMLPLEKVLPVRKWSPPPPFEKYLYFSLVVITIYIALFIANRTYRSRFFATFSEDLPGIFKTATLGILLTMSVAFLYRGFSYSRLVFFFIYLFSILFLILERYGFHRLKRRFLARGYNVITVALIGSPSNIRTLVKQFQAQSREIPLKLKGYICQQALEGVDLPHLGSLENLSTIIQEYPLDGFVIHFSPEDHRHVLTVLKAVEGKNLEIFYIPDILDYLTSRIERREVGGIPLLQIKSVALAGWQGFLKRVFDVVVSAAILVLLAPVMALIAVVIKLTSRGPVIYQQKRVALDGREFTMYKFRSMYISQEDQDGLQDVRKGDDRVTPVGRFLRRTSLDELPQLWNVLKGDMSLVGPRPERTYYVKKYLKEIPLFSERHRVRPGITGWAQVNGKRQAAPWEERVPYDLYYIQNWSLWFDIKILILTVIAIIKGENAY